MSWSPVLIHTAAFWGVALPVAVWLGFAQSLGANGLMWGMACGVGSAALMALARYQTVARRGVSRL